MKDYILYDTPGLTRMDSFLTHIDDELKTVVPSRKLKPRGYQLYEDQKHFARRTCSSGFDWRKESKLCCLFFSERLPLHRGKQEKADRLWETHLNELLSPSMDHDFHDMEVYTTRGAQHKIDVVIHGLGGFVLVEM